MTLSQAIRIAYAPNATSAQGKLEQALARAIVATWSASCSDRYTPLAPYHEAERQAQKALDAYLAETSDYLPAYCS